MQAEIQNLEKLTAILMNMAAKAEQEGEPVAAAGYTAAHAVYIHENMEIWPPGIRLKGLPRGQGFRRQGGVVYAPNSVITTGTVGGKNRGFYWDPQGRAGPKFLESPLRELRQELADIVLKALMQKKKMSQALLLAVLRLLRESQQRVPVDQGHLKASGFARLEYGTV